jgi:hypothetical protein
MASTHASSAGSDPAPDPQDFPLFQGGGLYHLLRWAHLAGDAPRKVRQRVAVFALFTWLPLLVLSALGGQLLGGVSVPFLLDVEAHIRFLVALPLLILAEVVVHRRLPALLRQFPERRLIAESSIARFEAAVASASRLRNSVLADLLIVATVYGFGILVVWRQYEALDAATWYVTPFAEGSTLTLAGMWYGYVSLPIVQFLLFRWYYRLFIWARFLWQVSRLELNLMPAHPDRAGGLGFLASVGYAFAMLAVAHGVLTAGQIASRIYFAGASLPEFAEAIAVVVVFMLCVVFGPLLFFAARLAAAKHAGLIKYEALAVRYVREFDAKWLDGSAPGESLVGSADIQSLADLGNSYEVVHGMRLAPVTPQAVLRLAAATLVPIVPLLLTMVPLSELLKLPFGILF